MDSWDPQRLYCPGIWREQPPKAGRGLGPLLMGIKRPVKQHGLRIQPNKYLLTQLNTSVWGGWFYAWEVIWVQPGWRDRTFSACPGLSFLWAAQPLPQISFICCSYQIQIIDSLDVFHTPTRLWDQPPVWSLAHGRLLEKSVGTSK